MPLVMVERIALYICIGVLFIIGVYRIIKSFKKIKDITVKNISFTESFIMAFVLSADNITIGIGVGLNNGEIIFAVMALLFSFLIGLFFLFAGQYLGRIIAKKTTLNLSYLSGVLLICLAIVQIFVN